MRRLGGGAGWDDVGGREACDGGGSEMESDLGIN